MGYSTPSAAVTHGEAGARRDAPGRVRAAFLVAVVGEDIVGRVSLRYELTAALREEGGHIGYGVVPSQRRRGYATQMLRGTLDRARSRGLERVLLTCDDTEPTGGLEPPTPCLQGSGRPSSASFVVRTPCSEVFETVHQIASGA